MKPYKRRDMAGIRAEWHIGAIWIIVFIAWLVFSALLVLGGPAMSPKLASQQSQPLNVPLVAQPATITVTVGWTNPRQPLLGNMLAITPLTGGATSNFMTLTTNRLAKAQVTAPSNSVQIMVAAIGVNGLQSDFSNPVTNQVPPPPPPLTNVQWVIPTFSTDLLNWQKQTNMAWKFTTPGYWKVLTATNL